MERHINACRLGILAIVFFLIPVVVTAQDFSSSSEFFTTPYKEGLAALAANKIKPGDHQAVLSAAEDGNAAAMVVAMGLFAVGSNGFAKDENKAKQWAEKAAEKGAYEGLVVLGEFYEKGAPAIPRRPQIAESYYERAAKEGFVLAKTRLAVLLIQTKFKTDGSRAVELLREAHAAGELVATRILGYMYLNGDGVQKDLNQAEKLLLAAAKSNAPMAVRGVGLVYSSTGPLHDIRKAESWLEKAVTLGDVEAPFYLALAYTGENGFSANQDISDRWLKRGEGFFHQVHKSLLYAVLSKRASPYIMANGTIVHAMDNAIAFEGKDGGVVQYATRFNFTNFDSARNPASLRLDLYTCGKQKGVASLLRADGFVADGNFVNAIIELRKQCGAEKTTLWLKRRAEEGYAQLQLEYADWLRKSQKEEAVYWAILGYLRMGEDVALCQDKSARGAPSVLLTRYRALAELVSKYPKDRYLALYEKAATESERMGVTGSPAYVCYHGARMLTPSFPGVNMKGSQPAMLPESNWPEERVKVRASALESVRKRSALSN